LVFFAYAHLVRSHEPCLEANRDTPASQASPRLININARRSTASPVRTGSAVFVHTGISTEVDWSIGGQIAPKKIKINSGESLPLLSAPFLRARNRPLSENEGYSHAMRH